MKRLILYLSVALLTFVLGLFSWFANPLRWLKAEPAEPLRIHVISTNKVPGEMLVNESGPSQLYVVEVKVENVSDKTIAGYALGYEGLHGRGALPPFSERQILKPGESQWRVITSADEYPRVWVDFVNFVGGSTWGPNQSYERDFVRE